MQRKFLSLTLRVALLLALILSPSFLLTNTTVAKLKPQAFEHIYDQANEPWVEAQMEALTLEQKVAQLIMLAVYSNKSAAYEQEMIDLLAHYQLGGLIFMQGGPLRQAVLQNKLQAVSSLPLLIGMDAEWGLSMRLDSTMGFPRAMALGAIQNDALIYDFGEQLAVQCQRLGVHVNFAPVLDINSNPDNPIINYRSFGENKSNVARKGLAYAQGMQDRHVMAVGKHFPGHGDTDSDSHYTLPIVNHSYGRIDTLELYPFRMLTKGGIGAMMVAHLATPNLSADQQRPASLSQDVVLGLLRDSLGFDGLVFTDALNMKGVTRDYAPGEIEVEALKAGSDILLFPTDIPKAIKSILKAVKKGELTEAQIDAKCRKVLQAKAWAGLQEFHPVDTMHLFADLHRPEAYALREKLQEASLTVLQEKNILPCVELAEQSMALILVGDDKDGHVLWENMNFYTAVDLFQLDAEQDILAIADSLESYDQVFVSLSQTSNAAYKNYGVADWQIRVVDHILQKENSVLLYFGNPYLLKRLAGPFHKNAVMVTYASNADLKRIAGQAVFGGRSVSGKLPVSVNEYWQEGAGSRYAKIRLAYADARYFALSEEAFRPVDSIVQAAMAEGATPGCQVLYAKDGVVVYHKAWGYHTYQQQRPVQLTDIYDLASVTKVMASTVSLMKLYDTGRLDPFQKVSKYNHLLKHTDKKSLKFSEFLAHQSGLHSWIPFYKSTLDQQGNLRRDLYRQEASDSFQIQVLDNLYLRNDIADSVMQAIVDTPLHDKKKYLYSDLGYYWMPSVIEGLTGKRIDQYATDNFYEPLGMNYTLYLPLQKFAYAQIVPSEVDQSFRKSVIHGFVNDQGAAMLGGVSGHAGLFSNANDLAKMSQMLLNGGVYGGKRYLKSSSIETFNTAYFQKKENRRALGFDKPAMQVGDPGPTCEQASQSSFGHSGFTGTYFWVDPDTQSVYVFLSNRTFPNADNNKLVKHDIRTKIQAAFYEAFEE